MKKMLFFLSLVGLVCFSGCTKEETIEKVSTYTFINNSTITSDGFTDYYIRLYEIDNEGNKIANNVVEFPEQGKAYGFTANKRADRVKAMVHLASGSNSVTRWINQVYFLEERGNIDVILEDHTPLTTTEP